MHSPTEKENLLLPLILLLEGSGFAPFFSFCQLHDELEASSKLVLAFLVLQEFFFPPANAESEYELLKSHFIY